MSDALLTGMVVTVADRGIGVSPAELPYVCERSRRCRDVDGSSGGSGSGLSSVRAIVGQHGGAVPIARREGTTASVWLPVHAPASPVEGSA